LGVGAVICGERPLKINKNAESLMIHEFPLTRKRLHLRDETGEIHMSKINKKWREFIKNKGIEIPNALSVLNDNGMSHVEIGKFIDENREAVFTKGA
jgi:hypothetical protein